MGLLKIMRCMRVPDLLTARRYPLPDSNQEIVITAEALQTFAQYRQEGHATEAGGLLFAKFNLPTIRILEASAPHPTDNRQRTLFVPNRNLQRALIKRCFKRDLHFVGEWHTHPEPMPCPSHLDLNSMADSFVRSNHQLNAFVMVIVGNQAETLNLWVSAHRNSEYFKLTQAT